MRSLFILDSKQNLSIDPALLGAKIFKQLWSRDKSKSKEKALGDLSYIYYMADFKSSFSDITDEQEKHNEVCKVILQNPDYQPDAIVLQCLELYKQDIPFSVKILEDAKIGANALRNYFREVDLLETDDNDKPKHDVAKLTNSLKSLSGILDTIDKLEEKVKRDLDINGKVTGGREKGMFEDPE